MKLVRALRRGTLGALCRIHLVDKCLILFMLVLLLQSAYTLLSPQQDVGDAAHIDVVVRTASASIFGYFLSANFIRHAATPEEQAASGPPPPRTATSATSATPAEIPQGRIGFALPEEGAAPALDPPPPPQTSPQQEGPAAAQRLQVLVAAGIGLFSLVLLLVLRNMATAEMAVAASSSATATVAQLRDFVSGCVGFLIGSPTTTSARK